MSELSARKHLVPYLFTQMEGEGKPRQWHGVSAYSLEDALVLLRASGYDLDLNDPAVSVREHVVLDEFELRHIGPNTGPMQFRGVWYPQQNLGDSAMGRRR